MADQSLPGPGSQRGYAPSVFVDTLVLLLQAGGQTLEDVRGLEREAAFLALLGHDTLPDPDTVGDWLRRMGAPTTGQAGLDGLGQVRDTLTARLLRRDGIADYTLDIDATLIEAEKREAQWSYQGVKGYMPLLGVFFETPVCLVDGLRDGNVSSGAGHLAFYRQRQTRLPAGKRLADLGVIKTHSRPHTSDNNPYSEAQFKTLALRQPRRCPALLSGLFFLA